MTSAHAPKHDVASIDGNGCLTGKIGTKTCRILWSYESGINGINECDGNYVSHCRVKDCSSIGHLRTDFSVVCTTNVKKWTLKLKFRHLLQAERDKWLVFRAPMAKTEKCCEFFTSWTKHNSLSVSNASTVGASEQFWVFYWKRALWRHSIRIARGELAFLLPPADIHASCDVVQNPGPGTIWTILWRKTLFMT